MSKASAGKLALALVFSLFSIQQTWGVIACPCEYQSQHQAGSGHCEQHCALADHNEEPNALPLTAKAERAVVVDILRSSGPTQYSLCCRDMPQDGRAIVVVSSQQSYATPDIPLRIEIEKPVALAFSDVSDRTCSRPLYLAFSCLLI
ncbi:MAG: hypothetical protein L0229_08305 [Blastocatellia bacterium]|nr:hypothetical protein [Blastocatellia bacterium]